VRRVLVPLDGSRLASNILPDARRLAGARGTLILIRVARDAAHHPAIPWHDDPEGSKDAESYLLSEADMLRSRGARVEVRTLGAPSVAPAIDEAARVLGADMIACATHGRSALGKLLLGSVAWDVLGRSPVPVLLRHPAGKVAAGAAVETESKRRILVPLDGSPYAETAIPLAEQLAREWNAGLSLARVAPALPEVETPLAEDHGIRPYSADPRVRAAQIYLDRLARQSQYRDIHASVLIHIDTAEALVDIVEKWGITDVVMTSHARTRLKNVILGSVAGALVQRLHVPLVVIPPSAMASASVRSDKANDSITASLGGSR
jgi:nucleotide-binding universal stress UspA family protein